MKNKILAILSVTALVLGFFIVYFSGPVREVTPVVSKVDQPPNNSQKWETKTDDQANVTVMITPLDLSPQSKEWKFDIGMNTHSVELDQDPMQITILVDDKENIYKPISWNGAPPGGHHREGVLIWKAIEPMPKSVEIKISSIGGVVRSFTWQI